MSTLSALAALEPRQPSDEPFPDSLQPVLEALAVSSDPAHRCQAAALVASEALQVQLAGDAEPDVVRVLVRRNPHLCAQAALRVAARRGNECVLAAQHPVLDDAQCVQAIRSARCRVAAVSPSMAAQFAAGGPRPAALELVASIVSYQALTALARAVLAWPESLERTDVLDRLRRVVAARLRGHNEPSTAWVPTPPKRASSPRPPVYPPFTHVAHLVSAAMLLEVSELFPGAGPAHGAQGSPVLAWWLDPVPVTADSDPVLRHVIVAAGGSASGAHARALAASLDCAEARGALLAGARVDASVVAQVLEVSLAVGRSISPKMLVDLALRHQDDPVLAGRLIDELSSVSVPPVRVPALMASSLCRPLVERGGLPASALLAHPSAPLELALDAPYQVAVASFHDRRALLEFMLDGLSVAQVQTLLVLDSSSSMSARSLRAAVLALG